MSTGTVNSTPLWRFYPQPNLHYFLLCLADQSSTEYTGVTLCWCLTSLCSSLLSGTPSWKPYWLQSPWVYRSASSTQGVHWVPTGSSCPVPWPQTLPRQEVGAIRGLTWLVFHLLVITLLGYLISSVLRTVISYILATFWLFRQENKSSLCYSIFAKIRSPLY